MPLPEIPNNDRVTPEWLLSLGAFENQGEIVLPVLIQGVTHHVRFKYDPFHRSEISAWYLFPSTGDGQINLPSWWSENGTPWINKQQVVDLYRVLGLPTSIFERIENA